MWLSKFVNFSYKISRGMVNTCLSLTVIMVVIDVVSRNIFGGGLQGTVEIGEYFLVIIGFLGIFQTHHDNGHITVDLLFDKMPQPLKRVVVKASNALIVIFSLFFLYSGVERFWSAFQTGETNWFGSYMISVWVVRIVVPVGFLFLGAQSMVNILESKTNI